MAQNITTFILLNVPLENDYKNTLYFNNKTEQETYFRSKAVRTFEFSSYQKKNEPIHCPTTDADGKEAEYDDLIDAGVNYVMYRNSAYTNKWFYAFIKEIEYISDGQVDIHIETDCIQTWLFDYRIKASFVEREHVSNDEAGIHTIAEGLETGEYICNGLVRTTELQEHVYVMMVTEWASGENKPLAVNYGGVFSAGGAYIFETMEELVNVVQLYNNASKTDSITAVYMVPKKIVNNTSETLQYSGQKEPVVYTNSFAKQTTLDGYEPRNKKLLCYPYNYILNSNNSGTSNILQYEHFSGDNVEYEIAGVPTIGGSIKCVPINYKGLERIQEEGILLGKFPTLSWSEDLFTNWIVQNGTNLNLGVASSGASIIAGAGMILSGAGAGVGAGMVAGGVMGILNTMAQVHKQELTPNSARGNVNGGDINTSYKMNLFYFYKMSIKKEIARSLDEFFDMFGYKVNRVKIPNKCHRSRFWYTKTIDINIDGAIPNNDIQTIKNAYNNGITFWRNPNEIQDYSLSNEISITEGSVTD